MNKDRRFLLQGLASLAALITARTFGSSLDGTHNTITKGIAPSAQSIISNFTYIYRNPQMRTAFFPFLENVFHLYPAQLLHSKVQKAAETLASDKDIYTAVQSQLDDIKPLLGDLTYALPALAKQKAVITEQTKSLLPPLKTIEGYLELGSGGRYLDALEEEFDIEGPRYCMNDPLPSYSIVDMVDRGQIFKAGDSIPLANYSVDVNQYIPAHSLDLVTVYIGLHHCPIALRDAFVAGLRNCLKPGGYLIIRDHNAHTQTMKHVVALAHDVFNMGTHETWAYNKNELRNFYDLAFLNTWLEGSGFKKMGSPLYQVGDPTLNALMAYKKV